jgi:sigma-B regulation protein RsbU (phosphoserine phosphatase)
MLMATARGILRSRCQEPGTLGELLTHMNELLVGDTGGHRFMTMLLMTIDSEAGVMRLASAGHDPPWLYDPATDRFVEHDFGGVPLGIAPGETYEERAFPDVRSGQIYLASTDGVWEARNEAREMFGKHRLQAVIRRQATESAAEISESIRSEVKRFQGSSNQDDDITFVVVKVG